MSTFPAAALTALLEKYKHPLLFYFPSIVNIETRWINTVKKNMKMPREIFNDDLICATITSIFTFDFMTAQR